MYFLWSNCLKSKIFTPPKYSNLGVGHRGYVHLLNTFQTIEQVQMHYSSHQTTIWDFKLLALFQRY